MSFACRRRDSCLLYGASVRHKLVGGRQKRVLLLESLHIRIPRIQLPVPAEAKHKHQLHPTSH